MYRREDLDISSWLAETPSKHERLIEYRLPRLLSDREIGTLSMAPFAVWAVTVLIAVVFLVGAVA